MSNESAEIIRMLNSAFDAVGATPGDFYPEALRDEIDTVNERIYHTVNNGVYKAGFATTQAAYEEAVVPLFESLDWLEARLGTQRYLAGAAITEADWRLFTTLVRFDRERSLYHNSIDYLKGLWDEHSSLFENTSVTLAYKNWEIRAGFSDGRPAFDALASHPLLYHAFGVNFDFDTQWPTREGIGDAPRVWAGGFARGSVNVPFVELDLGWDLAGLMVPTPGGALPAGYEGNPARVLEDFWGADDFHFGPPELGPRVGVKASGGVGVRFGMVGHERWIGGP